MATTGWIFNNFRETFDKWDSQEFFDENGQALKMRRYHWYLERYAKQQGGGDSVERVAMATEANVSTIDCEYMGANVNITALANFNEESDVYDWGSDGTGELIDRVISYNAQTEAGTYLITETWEGDGPEQYWSEELENWEPTSEGGHIV